MKNFIRILTLSLLLLAPLSACGSPVAATPTAAETAAPVPAGDADSSITVTDALGRTVTLTEPPSRIVIAGKANAMLVDAAYLFPEAATHIAAIAKAGQGSDFLPIVDPDAARKLSLEGDAGPEQIAAAQPDLVILKSFMAGKLGAPIEDLGIPVLYLDLETPGQYVRDLGTLGIVFQDEARAQEVIDFYHSRMERVRQGVDGLSDEQRPHVLVLQHSAKGGETAYNVPPASWMQTQLVEMAGGRPVWTDAQSGKGWTVVGLEQIAAWDPQQIYIVDYFADPAEAVAKFVADPNAQGLQAVQSGQVFAFPKDTYSWDQPDPRWILGLTWLAAHIHPEIFADVDMRQEVQTFYQSLYGLDEAAINDQLLPLLDATLPQPLSTND
ncbi:MAG: ABC transporter substrate-binding protein [Chloroflexi bacterium]|nr:ABC transporter substrate-binding protein [Chloroflexota bacterium]